MLDLKALEEPITRILTAPGTDLSTISGKCVRKTLLEDPEYAFLGLTPDAVKMQREEVNQVIAQIFDRVNRDASASSGGSKRKREEDEDEGGGGEGDGGGDGDGDGRPPAEPSGHADAEAVTKSPKKKKKSKKSVEESDAALARKLSSEINSRSRRGATLAAGASSSPRKAKRKPKKSAETVESEEEEVKPRKRSAPKGGFAKEYTLSDPLSAVLEVEKLSRPQVVKKLWDYIREHELQNPSNRKEILCDDALRAVFAVDKIDMFRMNKVLGQHLHNE